MYFYVQAARGDRDAAEPRALSLALNTPVIAIDELPVGPARAGIAVFEAPEGAFHLEIAVRSLRTDQVIFYVPDEELDGERGADIAANAALSFAEGMGFLFDEDEVAARGDGGCEAAAALWRELVEDVPEPLRGPEVSHSAHRRAEETAPVLDLVREVPVRDIRAEASQVAVGSGGEVVLSDISAPARSPIDGMTAPQAVLSKFRLVMGTIEPVRGAGDVSGDGEAAVVALVAPQDLRIRLLSRF